MEDIEYLQKLDKDIIWHPFTQMKDWIRQTPTIITEGRDCFIKDINGKWYIDGISSMWVNIHGHNKKEINEAITKQLEKIAHSTLLGLANEPSILLAEKLIMLISGKLNKVFYSDNGSTAVEVALKMAFQYWQHRGIKGKTAFVSLKNAYHGDTLGAISVGAIDIFHEAFKPLMFNVFNAPSPYCYRCELGFNRASCDMACIDELEGIFKRHSREICALIVEPMIQCAGGMIVAPSGYLSAIRQLCTRYDILLIADEVATGFGRTGRMFACEHEAVVPDIMCLSKGITGGYLPLAVTVATEDIYRAFLGEYEELKTFFHGHSYTGNQIGCAAAISCIELFEKDSTLNKLAGKVELLNRWAEEVKGCRAVGDVRTIGLMAGVELVMDKDTKRPYPFEQKMGWQICLDVRRRGVFLRPLGNIIVIMPPLAISEENLKVMLEHIMTSILEVTK
ncbi:MAG: adenosylmethionine--8-amino-7-oxononanoate transaminase [Candidatus Magnetoovum sp. WYHC-5]|nr:adenosylmethionine--8-amino-7-oxononanoate transaminase [Candidatus Magnetoovum sp. WYHC-5]